MDNRVIWKNVFLLCNAVIFIEVFWFPDSDAFGQTCAISFDNSASITSGAKSVTFSLAVSGSNRLLVVQVDVEGNDGASSITGASYGGAPMSQVLQTIRSAGGNGRQATFVLGSPALGTNNVVVDLAGAKKFEVGATDYNGIEQTNPVGSVTFVQDNSTKSHAITLTTTVANSWIAATMLWYSNSVTLSALGLGQTQRWFQKQGDSAEGSDKIALVPGSNTMAYTLTNSQAADIQAIELHPCGFVNTPTNTATLTATNTATSTATKTPTATLTNTPNLTATDTPLNTETNTPSNTPTSTPTLTATPTHPSSPSWTPTFTPSNTPTFTPIPILTSTPTNTPTPYPVYRVWPNPFTPELSTDNQAFFNIPAPHGAGEVMILDIRRRPVRTITFSSGVTPVWDGKDDSGRVVRSGLYVYLLMVDRSAHRGSIAVMR